MDTRGCSRFFMLGKIEVDDPARLAAALTDLHRELLADPYFDGVESFRPERNKTALLFHATDDVPEVRYLVFRLLRELGAGIRFHAVIRDKLALLERERAIRAEQPRYCYKPNALYDELVRHLFGKFHRLADRYVLCVAKRGKSDRNQAIKQALARAERNFESRYGFSRGGVDSWSITISDPETTVCLQAVDYFLWAVQRFYEWRSDPQTGEKLRDKEGREFREDRYLKMLWPQIAEIHDLDFGPTHGTFYTAQHPLTLDERFGERGTKKKRS